MKFSSLEIQIWNTLLFCFLILLNQSKNHLGVLNFKHFATDNITLVQFLLKVFVSSYFFRLTLRQKICLRRHVQTSSLTTFSFWDNIRVCRSATTTLENRFHLIFYKDILADKWAQLFTAFLLVTNAEPMKIECLAVKN